MTRFRRGVRCDGCGAISSSPDGYAVINGRGGHISSQGRNCEHDYCDGCEARHGTARACRLCGALPDGIPQRLGETVDWIRERIAECKQVEAIAMASTRAASGIQYHTAVTQRRTLEAVLARLEGRA